jgi:hypothetical protein
MIQDSLSANISGDQKTIPAIWSNRAQENLQSPIDAEELADFLGLSEVTNSDSAMLSAMLLAATEICINYTNIELLDRHYAYKSDRHLDRVPGFSGIAVIPRRENWWISLPVWPIADIVSVKVNGEEISTIQTDLSSKPARIFLKELGRIEIEYIAGHYYASDIPQSLLTGIKLLASFLYENRGACSNEDAIKKSGAAMLWDSQRVFTNL